MNGVIRPKQNDRNNNPVCMPSLGSLTLCMVIKAEQNRGGFKAECCVSSPEPTRQE